MFGRKKKEERKEEKKNECKELVDAKVGEALKAANIDDIEIVSVSAFSNNRISCVFHVSGGYMYYVSGMNTGTVTLSEVVKQFGEPFFDKIAQFCMKGIVHEKAVANLVTESTDAAKSVEDMIAETQKEYASETAVKETATPNDEGISCRDAIAAVIVHDSTVYLESVMNDPSLPNDCRINAAKALADIAFQEMRFK